MEDRVPLAGEALQVGVVQLVVEGPEGLLVRPGAAPGLAHQGGVHGAVLDVVEAAVVALADDGVDAFRPEALLAAALHLAF